MAMFPKDLKSARVEIFATSADGTEVKALGLVVHLKEDDVCDFDISMHGDIPGGMLSANLLNLARDGVIAAIENAGDHDEGDDTE